MWRGFFSFYRNKKEGIESCERILFPIVTCGTSGIGEEINKQLAASGCKVAANYFLADKDNAES